MEERTPWSGSGAQRDGPAPRMEARGGRARRSALVLATWNVLAEAYLRRYARAYPGVRIAMEARREAVAARLAQLCAAADVVLLQEVDAALLASLAERGLRFGYVPRPPDKPDGLAWWTAPWCSPARTTFARYEARHGGGERLARSWVRLDLEVERHSVAIVGTHMDPDPRRARGRERGCAADGRTRPQRQRDQADELIAELSARRADVAVIAGDLNGGPRDGARARLVQAGFAEATSSEGGVPATALLYGAHGWRPRTLDAVLVRGATATLDPVAMPGPPIPDAECPSDHLPLRATVWLP